MITFYNTPVVFFREAVESVLRQTYRDWQLFLVDDGSSDPSSVLARAFAEREPHRIQYVAHEPHENRGMSVSRQLGISKAQGEYVAFLDSDDVWLPHKLMEQVAILKNHPEVAMLYGNTLYWSTWSGGKGAGRRDFVPSLGLTANRVVDPPKLLPLFLHGEAAVPCTCSVLVRKTSLERVGGFEPRFRHLYEDQAFYVKVCLESPVYVSDGCWDKYRQHPESSCGAAGAEGERAARIEFLEWLETYLAMRGHAGGSVSAAVREELWCSRVHPAVRRALKPFRRIRHRRLRDGV